MHFFFLLFFFFGNFTGGGAIEMELSKMLRDYSRTIAGKQQLLIGAIAKALEIIPRQLCDNAGFDATNILNKLRQKHAQGRTTFFIYNLYTLVFRLTNKICHFHIRFIPCGT